MIKITESLKSLAFYSSLIVIVIGIFSIDFGMAGIGLILAVVAMRL